MNSKKDKIKKWPVQNALGKSQKTNDVSKIRVAKAIKNGKDTAKYLQENLEILEILFSNTHFLMAFLDVNFNFIRVNKAYAEYLGQSPDSFLGKNYFDLFPHKENEAIFRQVVESGESYTAFEKPFAYPNRPRKGMTYWWDWSIHPVKGNRGELRGLILSLVDVTRRKRAEEDVKVRDKRYQDLLEQSLDGFFRADLQGYIIESNQAFRDMIGYTEDELKSLSLKDLTPVIWLRKEEKILKDLFKLGYTPTYEKEYVSKEGNIVPVELRAYLTLDEKGKPVELWAFVRDITEKKVIEERLRGYVSRLEQSNRELEDFAYVASHDLQEPLRKVQTFGDRLFKKHAKVLDEAGRDYLERMINAATRMRTLIEALLSYSRVPSHAEPFTRADLNEALQEALSNLEGRIEETEAKLETSALPTIEANAVQMVQLLQNLIINALKFHREGVKPMIKVSCSIKQRKKRARRKKDAKTEFCEIYIKDNGIGFEDKYKEQIFMPLQRLHGRSEYEGLGIGLAICRRIVERHGGTIDVESKSGVGSTFIITLPLTQNAK